MQSIHASLRNLTLLGCVCIIAGVTFLPISSVQANPGYWGGGGYRGGWGGGYYHGGYCGGNGWYGTGIPNGLGWSLFGLGVAGTAAAVAAPYYYYATPPMYPVATAPVYYQPIDQTAVGKERSAVPSSDMLAKVQKKLAGLGYYKGAIDGEYGNQTAQAVQQFQADNNLPVSGRLDLKTLSSLGITL